MPHAWPTLAPAALIYADVARAVANLAMPNENEAKAVDARQEIDLRIGASFTRLQVGRYRFFENFRGGGWKRRQQQRGREQRGGNENMIVMWRVEHLVALLILSIQY